MEQRIIRFTRLFHYLLMVLRYRWEGVLDPEFIDPPWLSISPWRGIVQLRWPMAPTMTLIMSELGSGSTML